MANFRCARHLVASSIILFLDFNYFPVAEASLLTNDLRPNMGKPAITTGYGFPVDCKTASLTAGPKGPILLQDAVFLDEITHFDRERIPERVVHAKGAGAFGYFQCSHDITKYTKAKVFSQIGKITDVFVRFSTFGGESGSADTVRDSRGFAIKFYTEQGTWDLVCNDTPIFFIRDPMLFPSYAHSQKRNPKTHLKDVDMSWDFLSLRPESTFLTMILFSDRGIPDGFRFMDGYGIHTFKLVNATGEQFWCKFHFKTDQGIKNLTVEEAGKLVGTDPDYSVRDLYDAIDAGHYPSWTLYIQVMTLEEARNYKWNAFDSTKIWLESDHPLIPVGRLVLNRNPDNYFEQVEQAAFAPSRMIPGIEPSPDKLLQGRLFAYGDTQRHRLGPNFLQLPINKSPNVTITNQERDAPMCYHNQDGRPNYFPNSFGGSQSCVNTDTSPFEVDGRVDRYETGDDDNFSQATIYYRTQLDDSQRARLIENLANGLVRAKKSIRDKEVENFSQVDQEMGRRLEKRIEELLA